MPANPKLEVLVPACGIETSARRTPSSIIVRCSKVLSWSREGAERIAVVRQNDRGGPLIEALLDHQSARHSLELMSGGQGAHAHDLVRRRHLRIDPGLGTGEAAQRAFR